jgi:hypothetical protein
MATPRGLTGWLGTTVLALVVSFVAGTFLCFALGIAFNAREELIAAFFLIAIATLLSIVALVGVSLAARRARALDITAVLIVVAAAVGLVAEVLGQAARAGGRSTVAADVPLIVETLLPIAMMVTIQWWFMRRLLNNDPSA